MPTRFTVTVDGKLDGPDVILLPGLTSGRAVWAAEAARLARDHRVHLVQINGFAGQLAGANAAGEALLPAIVDELVRYVASDTRRPAVVGHSLGGLLALMLALRDPRKLSKLIIVDALPFLGLMFGPQATVASVAPMAASMSAAMGSGTLAQREAANARTAETLVRDAAGRLQVARDGVASDPTVASRLMLEDFQTDLRPLLGAIGTPTLVLYAYDASLIFPNGVKPKPEDADAITAAAYHAMPNAKLVRIDDSRHFIMFDQPGRLHEAMRTFLD